jgi:P27 family predicted phage terminase small subunit
MPGPTPKPTALKKLLGNPGHRPLNSAEPKPAPKLPACPPYLVGVAAEAYAAFAQQLQDAGIGTAVDGTVLAVIAVAYARWREAEEKIAEKGLIMLSPNGYPVQSPYVSIANKAMAQLHKLCAEFGMTPASRSRVTANAPEEEKGESLQSFMRLRTA